VPEALTRRQVKHPSGGQRLRSAHPFDYAQDRPFDYAQDRPFDYAQDEAGTKGGLTASATILSLGWWPTP